MEQKGVPLAQSVIALKHNMSRKNICTWNQIRDALFLARSWGFGKSRSLVTVSRVQFSDEEDQLYMRFFYTRQVEGLQVSDQWLKDEMDTILIAAKPPHWDKFCSSNGWVDGFKKKKKNYIPMPNQQKRYSYSRKRTIFENFLRSAFISTGFLVAKDRSEDHLIKMPGLPNYNF